MQQSGSVDRGTLDLEAHMAIPRLTLPRPHEAQAISVIAPTQRAIHWGHFRAVARVGQSSVSDCSAASSLNYRLDST
jgi:hypothetical protein